MLPLYEDELNEAIAFYERRELEALQLPAILPQSVLGGVEFTRVRGIADFWQASGPGTYTQRVSDFATGAHSFGGYLTFVLTGNPAGVELFVSLDKPATAQRLLQSTYPGIMLEKRAVAALDSRLRPRFNVMGMLSGIPSPAVRDGLPAGAQDDPLYLERIVRGMRDAEWVYVVQAYPRPRADVSRDRNDLLDSIARYASLTRQQLQRSEQASTSRTDYETKTWSEVLGGEFVNRRAEYTVELLELEVARLESALSLGRWQVAVYFGASEVPAAHRLASLLTGVFAGPGSRPTPIRAHIARAGAAGDTAAFQTYLSSEELGLLIQMPREEAPGYALSDFARFDVDFEPPTTDPLDIGTIRWEGSDSSMTYGIEVGSLTRHGAIFGVTGSGKTTTLLGMLASLRGTTPRASFLVIEPAKTEYRALLGSVRGGRATGPVADLRVYTLGNDTTAPFRLNPFEFDLADGPGEAPVLSHIDFLKAVFNAAFILYAPMPYVLETALHEIYEDKGWNLATGTNVRLPAEAWPERHTYPIFPTLTDLYHKIEAVTARLGYESRIEQDVIAGLKARVGSLRLGAKGLMLDVPRGIPLPDLLTVPTVLELEAIGNDDEKTFLMGLLLARIYGYWRLQAAQGKLKSGLQHLLIIEEAHRLLKNISTQVETESSNLRSQAIETFVNMLSEVRHYGQGVFVAEQIPSKLTPDVIKNTNLKLVQRQLAQEDRELLGRTMNMNESQMRQLATLRVGEAVAFSEGDDHPFFLSIDNFKARHHLQPPSDATLKGVASHYISLGQYLTVPDFERYGQRPASFGGPDPIIYQAALHHLNLPQQRQTWARILIRTIFAREALPASLDRLRQQIASDPRHVPASKYEETLIMLVVLGVNQVLQERGAQRGWSYPVIDSMRLALTTGLTRLVRTGDLRVAAPDLDRFERVYDANARRQWGPFPGCHKCPAICLYLDETRRLLSPVDRGAVHAALTREAASTAERYERVSQQLVGTVKRWLDGDGSDVEGISYCAALVIAPAIGMDEYEQSEFAAELAPLLLK